MKTIFLFLSLLFPLIGKAQDKLTLTISGDHVRYGTANKWGKLQVLPEPIEVYQKRDTKYGFLECGGKKYYITSLKQDSKALVFYLHGGGIATILLHPNQFVLCLPKENTSLVMEYCTYIQED